ncbi:hypothetical protein PtA15_6A639 [Puccinia triticina]|uniref:Uncharacterized protein n=1 Tax=Puccinia triticina TaxID=208348 RepID=A0ABY7CLA1_9BASI|nr:uncharacterized protein PtA15_6A639 [Puccinia triticina]WAQ86009.1 hypothetical protein PtA15_6A639 [Puccinia triticina]
MRGIDYTEADSCTLMRQTNNWLLKLHPDCSTEVVDFDLMAVFIMQETNNNIHITRLIKAVIETFSDPGQPRTTRQNQLLHASLLVQQTIKNYEKDSQVQSGLRMPFCLRYPNLVSVRNHARSLEMQCRILDPKKMVVLLDENGICVGVGLPPYPTPAQGSVHVAHDTRALNSLKEMVAKKKKSVGVLDKKIQFTADSIKIDELQGHGSSWKDNQQIPALPNPLRECPNTDDTEAITKLQNETTFYSKLNYAINCAFLPKSTSVAMKAIEYLNEHGSDSVKEKLQLEKNMIVASRTASVNTQIHTHRDKKNALLFDSVFFFGNHYGGEFLLPSLGVAYTGLHGYSFHGPFRILYHGVAKFYFKEDLKEPPQRFSLAMWSRESSFTAVARHAAYFLKKNKIYSNPNYWLPLYPKYQSSLVQTHFEDFKKSSRMRTKAKNRS